MSTATHQSRDTSPESNRPEQISMPLRCGIAGLIGLGAVTFYAMQTDPTLALGEATTCLEDSLYDKAWGGGETRSVVNDMGDITRFEITDANNANTLVYNVERSAFRIASVHPTAATVELLPANCPH